MVVKVSLSAYGSPKACESGTHTWSCCSRISHY